jgi:hypothetical protein
MSTWTSGRPISGEIVYYEFPRADGRLPPLKPRPAIVLRTFNGGRFFLLPLQSQAPPTFIPQCSIGTDGAANITLSHPLPNVSI